MAAHDRFCVGWFDGNKDDHVVARATVVRINSCYQCTMAQSSDQAGVQDGRIFAIAGLVDKAFDWVAGVFVSARIGCVVNDRLHEA